MGWVKNYWGLEVELPNAIGCHYMVAWYLSSVQHTVWHTYLKFFYSTEILFYSPNIRNFFYFAIILIAVKLLKFIHSLYVAIISSLF